MSPLIALPVLAIFGHLIGFNECSVLPQAVDITGINEEQIVPEDINAVRHIREEPIDHLEVSENVEPSISALLTIPSSRAYNCFLEANYDCDISKLETGAIIGSTDLLKNGAQNEETANARNHLHEILYEHRAGRWLPSFFKVKEHNSTHFITEISWTFKQESVLIDSVDVYLSYSNDYTIDQSIRRPSLNLICSENHMNAEDHVLRFNCYIHNQFIKDLLYDARGSGILLSSLRVVGADYAFYQIADISLNNPVKQIANFHGYVPNPPSRAVLCQQRINKRCGSITYEPQSVEGFKGFPDGEYSPPDGKIASGNNRRFPQLDEYGENRWNKVRFPEVGCHNNTHVYFNVTWYFTAPHSSESLHVYISNENYTPNEPLSRKHLDLTPISTVELYEERPPRQLTLQCLLSLEKYRKLSEMKDLLLLSVWNVYDTSFAFYQVMDLEGFAADQPYEDILRKCQ